MPGVSIGVAVRVYLFWPGVVAAVLGMLCLEGVVGSMGAVVVAAWTSWRIPPRNLPPYAPFFPTPGCLSLHILFPILSENPHHLGLPQSAWLFHIPPDPLWLPTFRWDALIIFDHVGR